MALPHAAELQFRAQHSVDQLEPPAFREHSHSNYKYNKVLQHYLPSYWGGGKYKNAFKDM